MKRWIPVAAVSLLGVSAIASGTYGGVTGASAAAETPSPTRSPSAELPVKPYQPLIPVQAPSSSAAPSTPESPTPSARPTRKPRSPQKVLSEALSVLGAPAGRYSLAIQDLDTGTFAHYGADSGTYDTASIVKVDILAALLLQAQARGAELPAGQQQLASDMIRNSDNKATDQLWLAIGGTQGLNAANAKLGLTKTRAGEYGRWGLTQTVARDQIRLLRAVFEEDSPLTPASQRYIRLLMSQIMPGQDWGVPAASQPGAPRVLKNGWLPRTITKLWDINSIGLVDYDGHRLLVAVLSADQPSRETGIDWVQRAAIAGVHNLVENESTDPAMGSNMMP